MPRDAVGGVQRRGRRPTLRDVAKAAFVSTATASLSLNDKAGVSEATRARVKSVAAELGYVRDPAGAGLRAGSGPRVGLIFDLDVADAGPIVGAVNESRALLFPLRLSSQLMAALTSHGMRPQVIPAGEPAGAVDVLVYIGGQSHRAAPTDLGFGVPIVTVGAVPEGVTPRVTVQLDHEGMTLAVLEHLKRNGYRTPGLLTMGSDAPHYAVVEAVFRKWCVAEGCQAEIAISGGRSDAATRTRELLTRGVDAIYDLTGMIAQVLEVIVANGSNVPNDVGLVSRSEGDLAAVLHPSVTSMSMQGQVVGQLAADAAARAIQRSSSLRETVTCPFKLTSRQSTARRDVPVK